MRSAAMLAGLMVPAGAAAELVVTKSAVAVADAVNTLNPRMLPGATVDYAILVTNANALLGAPAQTVTITDVIPADVVLRIADYGAAGSGPVEFSDGSLLGTGLGASGLRYRFDGLSSAADSIEFFDGASWAYVPSGTYDPRVRAIRIRLSGEQAAQSSVRLRFRVMVK